jgi:adenine-specific DNA glycosylase
MKSLVLNIRNYFNKRTRAVDAHKEADATRKTLVIENGESAMRLMKNEDFALLFNLYRFNMLERLEDSRADLERIENAHYVAGVRDFIGFIEKTEYLGKVAKKSNLTKES